MASKRNLERRIETVESRIIDRARVRSNAIPLIVPECALREEPDDDPLIRENGIVGSESGIPMVVKDSDMHQKLME